MSVLAVRKEILLGQLSQAHWILEAWIKELNDKGIPGDDYNVSSQDQVALFLRHFVGEMTVVSHMCEGIASVLTDLHG